jgi:lipoprotein NlpI
MWRPLAVLVVCVAGCGPTVPTSPTVGPTDRGDLAVDADNPHTPAAAGDALAACGQFNEAAAAYTQALANNPGRADLLDRRGDAHLRAGKVQEALADFDAAIATDPSLAPHHWRRGIALYYAGRFADGAAQFAAHRAVNPGDVENTVWHYLCVAKAESPEAARAKLLPVTNERRPVFPEVLDLFRGTGTPEAVDRAGTGSGPIGRFYADLYLGLWHDSRGEADKAVSRIAAAVGNPQPNNYMWDVAVLHQKRLSPPPTGR